MTSKLGLTVTPVLLAILLIMASVVAYPAEVVNQDKALVIEGPIAGGNINHLGEELLVRAMNGETQIDLIINSPGGSIIDGFLFINKMEAAKARGLNIRCFVPEIAASMAFGILTHCNERHALFRSFLLWHRARVMVGGIRGTPMTAPQAAALARELQVTDSIILQECLNVLPEMGENDVRYHFENETLHVASTVHALAPGFITVHQAVDGLYEAMVNTNTPRTRQRGGLFGFSEFRHGEIIYITDKFPLTE